MLTERERIENADERYIERYEEFFRLTEPLVRFDLASFASVERC